MSVQLDDPVKYFLKFQGQEGIPVNQLLGKKILLEFLGTLNCTACQRKISKSFHDGYCFPCFLKLAECDLCIMQPEKCHFAKGTCRDPAWGQAHCMQPHYVYLSNSSEVKVGITRVGQIPTRWIDQGAIAALPIFRVQSRYQSGIMEVYLKNFYSDKTNWQLMLKNQVEEVDLLEKREELMALCEEQLEDFVFQFGEEALEIVEDHLPVKIQFPVLEYPKKIVSLNFQKHPRIEGTLLGLKGQYLILDTGVLNMRKHTGYSVKLSF